MDVVKDLPHIGVLLIFLHDVSILIIGFGVVLEVVVILIPLVHPCRGHQMLVFHYFKVAAEVCELTGDWH